MYIFGREENILLFYICNFLKIIHFVFRRFNACPLVSITGCNVRIFIKKKKKKKKNNEKNKCVSYSNIDINVHIIVNFIVLVPVYIEVLRGHSKGCSNIFNKIIYVVF